MVLLLTLPVGAYVAGSVLAGQEPLPDRRAPVVVDDPTGPATGSPAGPGRTESPGTDDDRDVGDDGSDNRGRGEGEDRQARDDDVDIIRPEPEDIDDDGDDGPDGDRDDRGTGGGSSDDGGGDED